MVDLEECISQRSQQTLDALKNHNAQLFQAFKKLPYFHLLRGNTLEDPKRAELFLACTEIFSRFFQYVMFSRQATCHDPRFYSIFLEHMMEELHHDEMLSNRSNRIEFFDPVLEATSAWFAYQMFQLDNLEKALLVHWVLEVSGDFYHRIAARVLSKNVHSDYFEIHVSEESGHVQVIDPLLIDINSSQYERLAEVLSQSWAMLTAMVERITDITEHPEKIIIKSSQKKRSKTLKIKE